MVAFCGRILALGRWNLQMSRCKCPEVLRGQPLGMAADQCIKILPRHFFRLVFHKFRRHAKYIFPLMKAGLKEFILTRRARFNSLVRSDSNRTNNSTIR